MEKYYNIRIQGFYDNNMIATEADGQEILNASTYFWKMNEGEIINEVPIFDYFFLKSFDRKKYWEWKLNDVHGFIGEGSQIPGWLISEKLKKLLYNFKIAEPHFYYSSKLLFKEKKLDYYIFQFSGKAFRSPLTKYVNFPESLFYDPNYKTDFTIQNEKDLLSQQERILKESGFNFKMINVPIKRLVLNDDIDFISMQNFLGDKIVSIKLKQAIENAGITGFEFSELDYEVVVEE